MVSSQVVPSYYLAFCCNHSRELADKLSDKYLQYPQEKFWNSSYLTVRIIERTAVLACVSNCQLLLPKWILSSTEMRTHLSKFQSCFISVFWFNFIHFLEKVLNTLFSNISLIQSKLVRNLVRSVGLWYFQEEVGVTPCQVQRVSFFVGNWDWIIELSQLLQRFSKLYSKLFFLLFKAELLLLNLHKPY